METKTGNSLRLLLWFLLIGFHSKYEQDKGPKLVEETAEKSKQRQFNKQFFERAIKPTS